MPSPLVSSLLIGFVIVALLAFLRSNLQGKDIRKAIAFDLAFNGALVVLFLFGCVISAATHNLFWFIADALLAVWCGYDVYRAHNELLAVTAVTKKRDDMNDRDDRKAA
jgi:hypothetical protein